MEKEQSGLEWTVQWCGDDPAHFVLLVVVLGSVDFERVRTHSVFVQLQQSCSRVAEKLNHMFV